MGRSLGQPAQPPCQAPGQGDALFKKQGRQNLRNSTRGGSFVFYMPVLAHSCAPIHMCVYTHQTRPLILYLQ